MESLGIADIGPRRFRVDEYYRMAELGLIGEDERVELLDGLILRLPPGRAAARAASRLTGWLARHSPHEFSVRARCPLGASALREPEPDIAVVREEDERTSPREHPTSALLVMEVADSSLRKDRKLKTRIYAQANIPEYVIVDVARQVLEVYTGAQPDQGAYANIRLLRKTDSYVPGSPPGLEIAVSEIFN